MFLLKSIRLENGMTRAELARELSMNQGTLANYENEIRQASYEYLCMFADYFDITIDELLGRNRDLVYNRENNLMKKEEKEMVKAMREMSAEKRKLLNDFVKLLKMM